MGAHLDVWDVTAGHQKARDELIEMSNAAERYEVVRKLNPRQFADVYLLNITTGKPFDEIIDDLKPFTAKRA